LYSHDDYHVGLIYLRSLKKWFLLLRK
jgi:hypothetical protein